MKFQLADTLKMVRPVGIHRYAKALLKRADFYTKLEILKNLKS